MWRTIKLHGRDNLLKRKILPRINQRKGFILVGQRGTGKTAILEWAFQNTEGPKAFCSCTQTVRECLRHICSGWGLKVTNEDGQEKPISRWQVAWMEQAIFSQADQGQIIFIDDIERATPAFLRRLKPIRERFTIVAAGVPPFKKEELKRVMFGIAQVDIKPLAKADSLRLARILIESEGSLLTAHDLANASRGYPSRLVALVRGEIEEESPRVEGEEIDLSPLFLLGIGALIVFRYMGKALESTDLMMMGGVGMGLTLFVRYLLFQGMGKR